MKVRGILILSILAIFCAALVQPSAAAPLGVPLPSSYLYVGPGGYSTIQEAVDAANPGDVIVVAPGVYNENVEVYKENITIVSEDESNPAMVIAADPSLPVFHVTANNVSLIHLHIAGANESSGIFAHDVELLVVMGNFIENNTAGVNLDSCRYSMVAYNKIDFNQFAGIRVCNCSFLNMSFNFFFNNSQYGIYAENITTSCSNGNCIVLSDCGIMYMDSASFLISGNDVLNVSCGIALLDVSGAEVSENHLSTNAMESTGISVLNSYELNVIGNYIEGFSLGIHATECTSSGILYNNILSEITGISMEYSTEMLIANNSIAGSDTGLHISHCSALAVQGNSIERSVSKGIYACQVRETLFSKNMINDSVDGFYLYFSNSCAVEENIIYNHTNGLHLYTSSDLEIHDNLIMLCSVGILVEEGSNNSFIYLNTFIDNDQHALCHRSLNTWNTPDQVEYTYNDQLFTNFLGNYWDDYEGPDNNNDGIGDEPYPIEEDNVDNYPLLFSPFGVAPPQPPPQPPPGNYTYNMTLHIVAGWNLISIPMLVESYEIEGAPPEIVDELLLYGWNETGHCYYETDYTEPGKGYWLYSPAAFNLTLYGNETLPDYEAELSAGWHLLGSVYGSSAIVNCTQGDYYPALYGWNPNTMQYRTVQFIEEGRGYWFLTYTPAHIYVYPYPPLPP